MMEDNHQVPSRVVKGEAEAEAGIGANATREERVSQSSQETLAPQPDKDMEQRSKMQTAVIMAALCVRSDMRFGSPDE